MFKRKILGAALWLAFLSFSSPANAQCVEDPREVKFDQDNVIRLKSYLCRAGQEQNDPQIKVEFHRLSEAAASILVGKQPQPKSFKGVFGNFNVVENDVFKSYAELLQKFGEEYENSTFVGLNLSQQKSGGMAGNSDIAASTGEETNKKVRTIFSPGMSNLSYPSPDEDRLLAKNILPPNYHYDYSTACDDEVSGSGQGKNEECKQWNLKSFTMTVWRSLTSADLDNFRKNLIAYNRLVMGNPKTQDNEITASAALETEKHLKLAKHIAGDDWPADLLILRGEKADGCGSGEDPPWTFDFYPRRILLDIVSITNGSKQPVTLNAALGSRIASPRLRTVSPASSLAGTGETLAMNAVSIAPGQTVLVPTRVLLPADSFGFEMENRAAAEAVRAKVGANAFSGNTEAFGPPKVNDYAFGPEIFMNGLVVNDKPVELAKRDDNFVDVTIGEGFGSCPYLLTWDETDREWVNQGKVLDAGKGKTSEYSETKAFTGFRARFRIEEREPEIAHSDHAELVALLKNGSTLTLKSNNKKLAARDGDYLELMWGEGIGLAFSLPEGVAEEDVAESRFTLTGYYERYSNLLASTPKASSVVEEGGGNP